MTHPRIAIDVAANGTKLAVRCEFAYNGVVKDLPQRRWSKTERAWIVDATRLNAFAIEEWVQGTYTLTDAAKRLLEDTINPPEATTGEPFPRGVLSQMRVPPREFEPRRSSWTPGQARRSWALRSAARGG
jgi:hypothetical protein